MRVVGLVMLVTACGSVFDLEPVPELPVPSGGFARTITLTQATRTDLAEFPISVFITGDDALASHVIDGSDIGFTLAGAALPCEVVRFDREQGVLDAWVRIPVLPATPSSLDVELVYGAARTPCDATEMWASPEVAVWHGDLKLQELVDSSPHRHDLVAVGAAAVPAQDSGVVGLGVRYDGVDDSLCESLDRDSSLAFAATSFSYGVWLNVSEDPIGYDIPLSKGGASGGNAGFDIERSPGHCAANVSDGAQASALGIEFSDTIEFDVWHYLVAVVDRSASSVTTYLDGSPQATASLAGLSSFTTDSHLCVGESGDLMTGLVDEPRITHTVLTDDWIAVEYANLARRADVVMVGLERPN